jgi:hypothetical protein
MTLFVDKNFLLVKALTGVHEVAAQSQPSIYSTQPPWSPACRCWSAVVLDDYPVRRAIDDQFVVE